MNPKKRLQIDHVARLQIGQITANALDECEKIGAGLDPYRVLRYLEKFTIFDHPTELWFRERLTPVQMRSPLVGALSIDVGLIGEAVGKDPQIFSAALVRAARF